MSETAYYFYNLRLGSIIFPKPKDIMKNAKFKQSLSREAM